MKVASRLVNQQLVGVQQLLDCLQQGGSPIRNRVLLQAAYFQFELTMLHYIIELLDLKRSDALIFLNKNTSLQAALSENGLLAVAISPELKELAQLGLNSGSWVFSLLSRLRLFRCGENPRDELKSAIMNEVEVQQAQVNSNLLDVVDVSNIDLPSQTELMTMVSEFQELVQRHRSINQEY